MKIVRLAIMALVSTIALGGLATPAAANCVRNGSVSALTIAAELTTVQASCYAAPVCQQQYVFGDLETRSIDGYNSWSNWIWSGPSTTTFNLTQQNTLIASGTTKANAQKPAGKIVTKIVFFRDIIVGNGPSEYVVGEKVTYAKCIPDMNRKQQRTSPLG